MDNDTTPLGVSRSYWKAECARDVDAVMDHYHTDAVYEEPGRRASGHAEIRSSYEQSVAAYPGLEVEIIREFPLGDSSAIEFDAVLVDGAGYRHRIRGINVVTVRSGKLLSVRSYEDPPTLEPE